LKPRDGKQPELLPEESEPPEDATVVDVDADACVVDVALETSAGAVLVVLALHFLTRRASTRSDHKKERMRTRIAVYCIVLI